MIPHTPFMLSDFHSFCRGLQTHNKPSSPVHPPPSIFCPVVWPRWGTDTSKREALRKGESKAMRESRWVWTSVGPWGSLRKVAGDKAPEMRAQTGAKCSWTLPWSPAQQHPTQCTGPVFPAETVPVIQLYKGPQIRLIYMCLVEFSWSIMIFDKFFLSTASIFLETITQNKVFGAFDRFTRYSSVDGVCTVIIEGVQISSFQGQESPEQREVVVRLLCRLQFSVSLMPLADSRS